MQAANRLLRMGLAAAALLLPPWLSAAPDLNGALWYPISPPAALRPIKGGPVPLLPDAKALYERNRVARKSGNLAFDPTERCQAPGLPRLLLQRQPFEFLQRSERIFIAYQWNRLVRVVDMDVSQPEPIGPTYLGQSVGRWEGDALVVDSISFNDTTLLDDAGMPHSDELHLTERYELSRDGRRLQLRLTIEDPKTFSQPWETALNFRREQAGRLSEDICVERKGVTFWKEKQP
jgi:hypothetical protein